MDTEQVRFFLWQMQRRLDEMMELGERVLSDLPATDTDGQRFADRVEDILGVLTRRDEAFRMLRELRLPDGCSLPVLAHHATPRIRREAAAVMERMDAAARQTEELSERLRAVQGDLQERLSRVSRSLRFTSAYQAGRMVIPPGMRINQKG
ncbi:hypothetical protein [Alicyclobacillus herbarius]|uniref:hypothetical protein n=1 Tax=Alicyclobacillus herbarius TaxID=122960 RepID=UPI00041CF5DE|nr:hypothetical protein [Alicyclobacillus herbarius]